MPITTTPNNITAGKIKHLQAESLMLMELDNLNNMVTLNIHINSELINMLIELKCIRIQQSDKLVTTVSCAAHMITAALNVV